MTTLEEDRKLSGSRGLLVINLIAAELVLNWSQRFDELTLIIVRRLGVYQVLSKSFSTVVSKTVERNMHYKSKLVSKNCADSEFQTN